MRQTFGIGLLMGRSITSGTPESPPIAFGLLKDVTINMSHSTVEVNGQWRYGIDAANTKSEVSGKIGTMTVFGNTLAKIHGGTATAGQVIGVCNEILTIPASVAYTVTVAQTTTWLTDYGVYDLTAGKQLKDVTAGGSEPLDGHYTAALGVYTFNSAQASHVMQFSYTYTNATGGSTLVVNNSLSAIAPKFELVAYSTINNGVITGVKIPAAYFTKSDLSLKVDAWSEHNVEFKAVQSGTGLEIITLYSAEI